MNNISIGLLDFGFRTKEMNSFKITEDVVNYTILADKLGFSRLWLAEHHIPDSQAAWYNPIILLPLLAAYTSTIKIGVGGVLLGIHDSYQIALNFKLLSNLFSGRIDLGIAKGHPSDVIIKASDNNIYDIRKKLHKLINFLVNEELNVIENELIIPPFKGEIPEIWSLGSSYRDMQDVLDLGLNYCRSIFHTPDKNFYKEELDSFRYAYLNKHGRLPKMALAISGCCHNSEVKAKKIVTDANYKGIASYNVVGEPNKFFDVVNQLKLDYGFEEFIFLNVARDPKDRMLGIRLISRAFNLI